MALALIPEAFLWLCSSLQLCPSAQAFHPHGPGGAEEAKEEVYLIADDELPWVDAVRRGQTEGHFLGVHKGHTEVSKGSSVAAIHGLVPGVVQFDDHKNVVLPSQQGSHGCPDPHRSLHNDEQGESGEAGTQAKHHHGVGAPSQASQFLGHQV